MKKSDIISGMLKPGHTRNILEQKIIKKIRNDGPITFKTFMEMALYYPDLGYYSSAKSLIGRRGDFYTGPHLHSIFGAMIGKQLVEMWDALDRPDNFKAVEMGAGHGYLCRDIFDYLHTASAGTSGSEAKKNFLNSFHYIIIEPFAHFEKKQRELLADYQSRISWAMALHEFPKETIRGCFLSNELLDALPVHLVEMDDSLQEVYVTSDSKGLIEDRNTPSSDALLNYLQDFSISLQSGYRTEINLGIKAWMLDVSSVLSEGFILTIDYGYSAKEYYSEDRTTGTIMCYHKHMYNENPYQNIGEQDITAHINFSSIKQWGSEAGLMTAGYCPQGTYLISSGIDELISEQYSESPDYLSEISKIKGLIMPQGMGESHSVMVLYKGGRLPELRGFMMRNLAGNL
jgi:SAM-dependent MidA family methyltransferase